MVPASCATLPANLCRSLHDKQVLLLGAGGAARGVILPLLLEGPARLYIANRTPAKAAALVNEFNIQPDTPPERLDGGSLSNLAGQHFDIIINATSAGLTDSALDLPDGIFARMPWPMTWFTVAILPSCCRRSLPARKSQTASAC